MPDLLELCSKAGVPSVEATDANFREALLFELGSLGVSDPRILDNPVLAVRALYFVSQDLALDPDVSAEAKKLHDRVRISDEKVRFLTGLVETLWGFLDNIDTLDDACKDDDAAYRVQTRAQALKRWETGITTDGYTLQLPHPSSPESSLTEGAAFTMVPEGGGEE